MSAVTVDGSWSRDYRAFMRCDADPGWMHDVEQQLAGWLREKGAEADVTADVDVSSPERDIVVRRSRYAGCDDLRLRMVESNVTGLWMTELLVHEDADGSGWIDLAVRSGDGKFVAVPRIAKYLMGVLPLGDGAMEFVERPRICQMGEIDDLVALLTDVGRCGPVFVAGTSADAGIPFDAFAKKVGDWAKQIHGLGQVVVLDPLATEAFARKVGTQFAAPAWTLRTYLPGVSLGEPPDARRHRILGTTRLATQPDGRIQRLLGEIARTLVASRSLPAEVQRVRRRFDRLENQRLVEALEEAPSVEEPTTEPLQPAEEPQSQDAAHPERAQLDLVRRVLGLKEITEAKLKDLAALLTRGRGHQEAARRLQERVEQLQGRVERLEDAKQDLEQTLADQQMEHEVALLDLDDRDAKIRWLESRLKEKGDYEAAYLDVPEEFVEHRPASFDELLERIDGIQGVEFTGDRGETEKLNALDTNDAALRVAWDAVLAMADYAKARAAGDFDGGLDAYINRTPPGYRGFPPGKWGATETAVTMQGWGDERIFPVPKHIDASGCAEMKAHFKLARIGMATPRMHVLDCHPGEPVIYIGYIGTHLTNTKTN